MLKKLSLVTLLVGAASLGLVACDGEKSATGVAECDQYIAAVSKLVKDLPSEQKAAYDTAIEKLTKSAKNESPQQAKALCKGALEMLPSYLR